MVVAPFEQLVGAAGDVRELEYISALHQTDLSDLRRDGSIRAEDIRLFLSSRYGIRVSVDDVKNTILHGLGGSSRDDEVIDLMELVAILLIPTLLKEADQLEGEALPEGVVAPPHFLEYVLKMILHDVTGSSIPKRLTPALLHRIFTAYGEREIADDNTLLQEMVEAAQIGPDSLLDVEAFAKGLCHDTRLYDIRNEVRLSTNIQDVFLDHELNKNMRSSENERDAELGLNLSMSELRERLAVAKPVERKFTAPAIDITAGLYRSKTLMVLLWSTVLVTYFAYLFSYTRRDDNYEICPEDFGYQYSFAAPWSANRNAIACDMGTSVLTWLMFFLGLCIYGLVVVCLGSLGNYVGSPIWKPPWGAFAVFLTVVVPFVRNRDGNDTQETYLHVVALILGLTCILFHLSHFLALLVRRCRLSEIPRLKRLLTTSTMYSEAQIKHAAAYKVALMTLNALQIVRVNDQEHLLNTHFGQALDEYARSGKQYRKIGGFKWTWRRLLSREAFSKDGIWIGARLIASNITQYVVSLYVLLGGLYVTRRVADSYDQEEAKTQMRDLVNLVMNRSISDSLVTWYSSNVSSIVGDFMTSTAETIDFGCGNFTGDPSELIAAYCTAIDGVLHCDQSADVQYLCPLINGSNLDAVEKLALLGGSGFDQDVLTNLTRTALQQASDESIDSLYPSAKYMVTIPLYVATIVAFLTAAYLALTYIPSVTKTVMLLRSGAIPTLRDKNFLRYRVAADQVSILTGSLFWGCFISSAVVGGFLGLIIFIFLWQATAYIAQRFVAMAIGVVFITMIRLGIVMSCRCTLYRAFYRRKPAAANLSMLALEWANFALSAGFVFMRMVKLLVVAGTCIGRIDRPFLAEGMGRVGPIELDGYPLVHTKDVLSHEAHRHPYIETLGVMYLMKLRYAEHFGKTSGSCWRLLFVYALFPWLHRYRMRARPDQFVISHRGSLTDPTQSLKRLSFISLRKTYDESAELDQSEVDGSEDGKLTQIVIPEHHVLQSLDMDDDSTGAVLELPQSPPTDSGDTRYDCFAAALDVASPGDAATSEAAKERIRQLEEENDRLREALDKLREDKSKEGDKEDHEEASF